MVSGCLNRLGECMVGQVVNLRRRLTTHGCVLHPPSAGGLTTPPQDAILPHKSLLPNTPPIRLRTPVCPTSGVRLKSADDEQYLARWSGVAGGRGRGRPDAGCAAGFRCGDRKST